MHNIVITVKRVRVGRFEKFAVCANGVAYKSYWGEAQAITTAMKIENSGLGVYRRSI